MIDRTRSCDACAGTGECPSCEGEGFLECSCPTCGDWRPADCVACTGSGSCPRCGGSGVYQVPDAELEAAGQLSLKVVP